MPLIAHSGLPAFAEVATEGAPTAVHSTGKRPTLRIGVLNLMPDAALRATDRQWARLFAVPEFDTLIHPFTVASEQRGAEARGYIGRHYSRFDQLRRQGLDALVVTGANPAREELSEEAFWPGLVEVLEWAEAGVGAVLCSCLATHAVLEHRFGVKRSRLPRKMWGWFSHEPTADHPLLRGFGSGVVVPHSRWYDVDAARFEGAGIDVLAASAEAGVLMAATQDDTYLFLQGHIEYDVVSLAKDYQRELDRYLAGEIEELPPYPEGYFPSGTRVALEKRRAEARAARLTRSRPPDITTDDLVARVPKVWEPAARAVIGNWLARIASRDRGGV